MARVVLPVQFTTLAGIAPAYTVGDAGNNHQFQNDGNVMLHVKNTSATPTNVTIETPNKVGGLVLTAPVIAVPITTGDRMIGPFDPTLFNQAGGVVFVDISSATGVTLAAIEI
ncbi:MAG: hypothetical protein P4L50_03265 [Anaerolineaceae bacterium]|nr:hypothetical protein [Anaerolineaceae bacterium]